MKKLNKLQFNINYLTNFKPIIKFHNKDFFKSYKKNQIISRNFFLFLKLVSYYNKSFKDKSIFIKPIKKKIYTILRSPYRHKLTRHQISLNRYEILFKFNLFLNNIIFFKNMSELTILIKNLKNLFCLFESNIVYVHKIKFKFFYSIKNFFKISNYKKNIN